MAIGYKTGSKQAVLDGLLKCKVICSKLGKKGSEKSDVGQGSRGSLICRKLVTI